VMFAAASFAWFVHVGRDWFTAWWGKGRRR